MFKSLSELGQYFKRVAQWDAGMFEVLKIPGGNRQSVLKRRCRNQTVFHGHCGPFPLQVREEFSPCERRSRVEIQHVQTRDSAIEPPLKIRPFATGRCQPDSIRDFSQNDG